LRLTFAMLITGAVVDGKERVAPGCLSPGASLRVGKRACGNSGCE